MYGSSSSSVSGVGGQQSYPFAYDPGSYGLPQAQAGPSSSSTGPSYEYSYSRSDLGGQGTEAIPVNVQTMDNAFQDSGPGWHHQDQWPAQAQQYDASYPYPSPSSDWARPQLAPAEGSSKSQNHWPGSGSTAGGVGDYTDPSGPERELSGLRMTLSDLVESIRPYASSPSNPRPPPPPTHLQARFLRLASTVQTSLSNLQPHIHPFLHPSFSLPPPHDPHRRRHASGSGSRSRTPLTSAEKEMEVIRKRRDMLIARAAQVQASSNPHPHSASAAGAVHNTSSQQQLPSGWNHGELYANGGGAGLYSTAGGQQQQQEQNMFDLPAGFNSSSRRSTMTLDNFDASLARFSLDPSRAAAAADLPGNGNGNGNGNTPKKASGEAERCHGCGVSVTAEWRRGPDGPRSLCNACGLHYAKLARRRAQEEASNANANANLNGNGNGVGVGNSADPMAFPANALA